MVVAADAAAVVERLAAGIGSPRAGAAYGVAGDATAAIPAIPPPAAAIGPVAALSTRFYGARFDDAGFYGSGGFGRTGRRLGLGLRRFAARSATAPIPATAAAAFTTAALTAAVHVRTVVVRFGARGAVPALVPVPVAGRGQRGRGARQEHNGQGRHRRLHLHHPSSAAHAATHPMWGGCALVREPRLNGTLVSRKSGSRERRSPARPRRPTTSSGSGPTRAPSNGTPRMTASTPPSA
jgi:hypothetical protein